MPSFHLPLASTALTGTPVVHQASGSMGISFTFSISLSSMFLATRLLDVLAACFTTRSSRSKANTSISSCRTWSGSYYHERRLHSLSLNGTICQESGLKTKGDFALGIATRIVVLEPIIHVFASCREDRTIINTSRVGRCNH
ncbi:hypothetical protein PAXINDRAFT_103170 [Paxillus involutus ATCC 200175]|uniref:Uncharacterized protein n=1 Tax=Paxillus involutus ATCC 200175 TaxID=664439 RepID=A0A0C9SMX6_PAXIN|nr:hypothetical protein PAXINDRAFT_103170 [Paxillus involutus ATCC 200175]